MASAYYQRHRAERFRQAAPASEAGRPHIADGCRVLLRPVLPNRFQGSLTSLFSYIHKLAVSALRYVTKNGQQGP